MDEATKARHQEACEALRQQHKDGSIDQLALYKGMVIAAYNLAKGDELGLVSRLLMEVPVSYFIENDQMLKHMEEDPIYDNLCIELARLLVVYGIVDGSAAVNQSQGVA